MNISVHMGIYLTLTPEVLATVYLNISISFKNSG